MLNASLLVHQRSWNKNLLRCLIFSLVWGVLADSVKANTPGSSFRLMSPTSQESPYYPTPLPDSAERITTVSDLSTKDLLEVAEQSFNDSLRRHRRHFSNSKLARLYKFAVVFDDLSHARYERGVQNITGQRDMVSLMNYVTQTRWWGNAGMLTEDSQFSYSESRLLRILIASHVGAHFYQLSYPTFFCLLFQESKFDFKIVSPTGAVGLGQLTNIGVQQIEQLREEAVHERLLQAAAMHLKNVYRDRVIHDLLISQGFRPHFPDLGPLTKAITKPYPGGVEIVNAVSRQLLRLGHSFGRQTKLIKELLLKLSHGQTLDKPYAIVDKVFNQVLDEQYNQKFGNVLNIETNILISAMLLHYYMEYDWSVNQGTIQLHPAVKSIVAVAAYNQGQSGVLRFLGKFKRDFPNMDLRTASLKQLQPMVSAKRIQRALPGPYERVREVYQHVLKIGLCSHKPSAVHLEPEPGEAVLKFNQTE